MKKKIIIISILAVFMLIAISVVTAASMQTTKSVKEKVSPLFGIRTRQANNGNIRDTIKMNYKEGRIFFVPLFRGLINRVNFLNIGEPDPRLITSGCKTWEFMKTCVTFC